MYFLLLLVVVCLLFLLCYWCSANFSKLYCLSDVYGENGFFCICWLNAWLNEVSVMMISSLKTHFARFHLVNQFHSYLMHYPILMAFPNRFRSCLFATLDVYRNFFFYAWFYDDFCFFLFENWFLFGVMWCSVIFVVIFHNYLFTLFAKWLRYCMRTYEQQRKKTNKIK